MIFKSDIILMIPWIFNCIKETKNFLMKLMCLIGQWTQFFFLVTLEKVGTKWSSVLLKFNT